MHNLDKVLMEFSFIFELHLSKEKTNFILHLTGVAVETNRTSTGLSGTFQLYF